MDDNENKYHASAGETFDSIALAIYGDESYAADVMNANPSLLGKAVFMGGELVSLPTIDTASYYPASNAPWKE